MRPTEHIDLGVASHQHMLQNLAPLADDDVRAPSLLPGWSRGHVITHLANKTRSHVWLFGGPENHEVRRQFPEGYQQEADIEEGAYKAASELRSDLGHAFERLEEAWDALPHRLWDHEGIVTPGRRTMSAIVLRHLRDVEVHHVDLDIGYLPSDWPTNYIDDELSKRLEDLPQRANRAALLAWLLGRAPAPELGPW